ncbi:MAG: hypothetical protein ACJ754_18710 [Pyrinomonadaceae bacterium]
MPRTTKVPTLYDSLKERRERLRQNLNRLANAQFTLVRFEDDPTEDDLPRAILKGSVRVRKTNYLFHVWEDFRDSDGRPFLYGFTYSLQSQDPASEPVFRYECHPDVEDQDPSHNEEEESEINVDWDKRNPYGLYPHFHPHKSLSHPISRLHYPFQRSEREGIVFSLIAWIDRDLVKRFYDSGRVTVAS